MNYTRKFKKNAKALSPVVASIILIAVTVAVSVVVAAWMGGMSIGLMGNAEQLSVTNVEFVTGGNSIILSIQNTGGANAEISKIYINGGTFTGTVNGTTIDKGAITDFVLTTPWTASTSYDFKLTTAKGNNIAYTAVSPA
jgi:flagellin-like protein